MKATRSTLVLPLAGLLVLAGAGAAVAANGGSAATGSTPVVPAADPSASPSTGTTTTPKEPRDTLLSDVLDDLVTKGTIDAGQRQAILDALDAERTARRQEREQLREFLADGQITQDELDQLPEDSPLRRLTTLLDDGTITLDELRDLGGGFGFRGRGHGFGHGFFGGGPGGDGPAPLAPTTPDASPAPSSGTSG